MSDAVLLLWDEDLMKYDLGGTHPMDPGRLEMTMALARDLGVLARPNLRVVAPRPASDEVLALVHDPGYIAVVPGAPLRCTRPAARRPPAGRPGQPGLRPYARGVGARHRRHCGRRAGGAYP